MSRCQPDERHRSEVAEHAVAECDGVVAVDRIGPETDPTAHYTIEVVLAPSTGGLPPALHEVCGEYGLTARRIARQGPYWEALLVA